MIKKSANSSHKSVKKTISMFESTFDNSEFIKLRQKLYGDELPKKRHYYYINIWNIGCAPCIEEIPILNSISEKFDTNTSCIMLSQHSDQAVSGFLLRNSINIPNFIFANNMKNLISNFLSQIKEEFEVFPLHLIVDSEGRVLAYLIGAFTNEDSASPIIKFLNHLK